MDVDFCPGAVPAELVVLSRINVDRGNFHRSRAIGHDERAIVISRRLIGGVRLIRETIQIAGSIWLTGGGDHEFGNDGDDYMPATKKTAQGKTMFVKEVLHDNPLANARAVNDAWEAAGMEGKISATLVSKMRARMGLSGNLRGRRGKGGESDAGGNAGAVKRRGRPPKQAAATSNGMTPAPVRGRTKYSAGALEIEFDRLLLKVVEFGNLPDVETALRKARHLLYAGTSPSN